MWLHYWPSRYRPEGCAGSRYRLQCNLHNPPNRMQAEGRILLVVRLWSCAMRLCSGAITAGGLQRVKYWRFVGSCTTTWIYARRWGGCAPKSIYPKGLLHSSTTVNRCPRQAATMNPTSAVVEMCTTGNGTCNGSATRLPSPDPRRPWHACV